QNWNGIAIIALQNANGPEIGITSETIRSQRDYLRVHGDSFFVACMRHVEKSEPIVGSPVARANGDGLFVQFFGLFRAAQQLVSSCKSGVGIIAARVEFEGTTILHGSAFVVASCTEDMAKTRVS